LYLISDTEVVDVAIITVYIVCFTTMTAYQNRRASVPYYVPGYCSFWRSLFTNHGISSSLDPRSTL